MTTVTFLDEQGLEYEVKYNREQATASISWRCPQNRIHEWQPTPFQTVDLIANRCGPADLVKAYLDE